MRCLRLLIVTFLTLCTALLIIPHTVAAQTTDHCELQSQDPPEVTTETAVTMTFTMATDCLDPSRQYFQEFYNPNFGKMPNGLEPVTEFTKNTLKATFTFTRDVETWNLDICKAPAKGTTLEGTKICDGAPVFSIQIKPNDTGPANLPSLEPDNQTTCKVKKGGTITFKATNVLPNQTYHYWFPPGCTQTCSYEVTSGNGETELNFEVPTDLKDALGHTLDSGPQTVCIDVGGKGDLLNYRTGGNCLDFTVTGEDGTTGPLACGTPAPPQPPCPTQFITPGPHNTSQNITFAGCDAVYTGLGIPISTNPGEFVSDVFTLLLSISGGILLLLIIYSGYQMMTSQGNPEKIQVARERLTSAIVGFMFLIFSLVILEVIGVDILHIPRFCGSSDHECAARNAARGSEEWCSIPSHFNSKECKETGPLPSN